MRKALFFVWRLTRGMTLGARAVVLDEDGRVLLVEHSYVAGWHLPGGGVERGETMAEALAREVCEEGGVELTDAGELVGIYQNGRIDRRDHVALFVCRSWRSTGAGPDGREIINRGFFALDSLPANTSPSVHRRIGELFRNEPVDPLW
ncbi:MAG: NUDIX domain-containing protein [Hyphomicrobiales bacterium]